MSAGTYGWLILLFPLAGSMIIAFGRPFLPGRSAGWLGTAAIFAAFISAIGALWSIQDLPEEARHATSSLYEYASAAGLDINLGIFVDPLSVFMCLIVSGVSTLIHLYSISYMTKDAGFVRYFSYLNFFVFSMLLLVLAGNYVLLVVGWAFVGFASYALISFWYRRGTATKAGMKAFVINVGGDVGMLLAAFLIVGQVGSFEYLEVFSAAEGAWDPNSTEITAICLLLLVGALAKSAQIPLHTWLPDAMEGPTPVSSLIHAATMVTAGVYLIARSYPLFELSGTASDVAAFLGLATLIFAGTVALAVTDLKRIIAYSTCSQIGYMIVGVSIGAYSAGLFHLLTHAFFKALLFMAAGSIIGAMAGVQHIDRMHGMKKALPFTSALLLIGALALAGMPPFSGAFSKDEILVFAAERGGMYWIFCIGGYLAAAMTAFYAFRITFRVTTGEPNPEAKQIVETGELPHGEHRNPANDEVEDTDIGFPGPEHFIAERELPMKVAMTILGIGATFLGFLQLPGVTEVVAHFLDPVFEHSKYIDLHPSTGSLYLGLLVGGSMAIIGIGLAYRMYVSHPGTTGVLEARFPRLHAFLFGKWYFDELYDVIVYRPIIATGRFASNVLETTLVQGVVDGAVGMVKGAGSVVRGAQTGFVRAYALLVVTGVAGLALYFLIVSNG